MILRSIQSGLIEREKSNVRWDIQRSSTGSLLQVSSGTTLRIVSSDERMLSLDDTQGMFLLLAIGVVMGLCALSFENVVGRVGALRDLCPPGPRRRSSVGLHSSWSEDSTRSSVSLDSKEDRPSFGVYRRSIKSLPGNVLEQIKGIAKNRESSVVSAPPVVFVSTHSMNDIDEAACFQTSDESEAQVMEKGSRTLRSFSIFSWLSSLAEKFRRESQGAQILESSSTSASRDRSDCGPTDQDRQSSTKTYTVDPIFADFEGNLERGEPAVKTVESVFGSRQDFESSSHQISPDETTKLSTLQLLKPLEQMEEAEKPRASGLVEVEPTTSNLEMEQSTSNQESISIEPIEVETEDVSKSGPPEEKQSESEKETKKLHRRTPSTISRTPSTLSRTTTEGRKKFLQVPRATNRPK